KAEKEKKDAELKELQKKRLARSPLEGRGPIPVKEGDSTVVGGTITGATIWTCGPAGLMTNANLNFREGKIVSVNREGTGSSGPPIKWIDGTGLHITPGLI